MIVFYLLLLLVIFYKSSCSYRSFYDNYLNPQQCNSIKGIFILLIFLSHIIPYITKSGYVYGQLDKAALFIANNIGQLVVVMFLFYSGYGVTEQVRKKGTGYINSMPKKRILVTLLNFDIAVMLFVVTSWLLGIDLSVRQIILSLFCWDSVGNSNWYIFVILICYTIAYLSYKLIPASQSPVRCLPVILTIGGGIILASLLLFVIRGKESWWYNTMWAFPFGIVYSAYKVEIERFVKERWIFIVSVLILALLLFKMILTEYNVAGIVFNCYSLLFSALIVIITQKVKIENKYLDWCGKHLFPIYIYQRIPMMIIYEMDKGLFVQNYPYIYVAICFCITLLIANYYKFWTINLFKK